MEWFTSKKATRMMATILSLRVINFYHQTKKPKKKKELPFDLEVKTNVGGNN